MADPYRPLFVFLRLIDAEFTPNAGFHATVSQFAAIQRRRILLDPYVWKRTLAHHLQRLCAQASVAERQLCSRLNGGIRDVSAPRPRPSKPKPNRKPARAPLFDPAVFLATAAVGRDISKYSKKASHFCSG